MEWLRRNGAPLSEKAWRAIDETANAMFKQTVVARRIVDFDGPRGWNHVATQLGTFKPSRCLRVRQSPVLRPGRDAAHRNTIRFHDSVGRYRYLRTRRAHT